MFVMCKLITRTRSKIAHLEDGAFGASLKWLTWLTWSGSWSWESKPFPFPPPLPVHFPPLTSFIRLLSFPLLLCSSLLPSSIPSFFSHYLNPVRECGERCKAPTPLSPFLTSVTILTAENTSGDIRFSNPICILAWCVLKIAQCLSAYAEFFVAGAIIVYCFILLLCLSCLPALLDISRTPMAI